ncbi:MAG: hypothetical protein JWP08_3881 [Bryobacterales bacterium]|nr:hypothetical protein [Bryobacterales bacterium]
MFYFRLSSAERELGRFCHEAILTPLSPLLCKRRKGEGK